MYEPHVRAWITAAAACTLSLTPSRAAAQARYEFPDGTAEAPGASTAAHRLLVQLNRGVDLGTARSAWATWISTL